MSGTENISERDDSASMPDGAARLRVEQLIKSYRLGEESIDVLRGLSLSVSAGEIVSIMGPSGSGKTTLLNCISGIDSPDAGDVSITHPKKREQICDAMISVWCFSSSILCQR
ncbi:MAG: hypothetical protein CMM52_09985 [Rhodospirillaceae bacterium]|nr:hypothetical protein [Rhodospirillaceae bacterium]